MNPHRDLLYFCALLRYPEVHEPRQKTMPTWVVTGTSSGIGLELTKQILEADSANVVYATVRTRASSASGEDHIGKLAALYTDRLKILEGIDIAEDAVKAKLAAALEGVTVDVVIHNAGGLAGYGASRPELKGMEHMGVQSMDNVSMEMMQATFNLNTLGPLRVQQAVNPMLKSPGGKVAVISTGFGSISDNGSGGVYAYRVSKAGVNMLTKNLSCDLKKKDIAAVAINPGMVKTEFGPGLAALTHMGALDVDVSCKGVLKVIDALTMETTGTYWSACSKANNGEPAPYQW